MIKSKRKVLFAFFLAVMIIASAYLVQSVVRAEEGQSADELKSEYFIGEEITVPSGTVVFPSGAAIKNGKVTLSEAGKYTVLYGEGESKTFDVYKELYSFSGNKSSAEYGLDKSQYDTGKTALNVKLAAGEVMTFNQIINLKELDGDSFINFYATPEKRGTAEVQGIYFVLTDIYNPDNKVTFQFKNVAYLGSSYVYTCSYVTAGHGNEVPRAYAYDAGDRIWRLRINDKFGTAAYMSLYGWAELYGGLATRDSFCKLSLDLNSGKAYTSDPKNGRQEIIDLNNPSQFDAIWEGFTTGEVRLSVEAYDYTGATFNLNITDLYGHDFKNGNYVSDDEEPILTVDTEGYDENNLPHAVKGKTYPVFSATAFDKVSGELPVDVRVYYGYDSDRMMEINHDGKSFPTTLDGKYKIVYTAIDAYKNQAVKELKIIAEKEPNSIVIDLQGEYATSCKVGEKITLPTATVTGGFGQITLKISADQAVSLNEDKMTVQPLKTGKVKIIYTATDMTGYSETKSYELTVSTNESPVILREVILPEYLLGGLSYVFPRYTAHDFNTEKEVETSVYVDGLFCENNKYKAPQQENPTLQPAVPVKVLYKVGETVVCEREIPVLDVKTEAEEGFPGEYDITSYFVTDAFDKSATKDYVVFSAKASAEENEVIKYAKPIIKEAFSIGFTFKNSTFANAVKINLTDAENSENVLEIKLMNNKVKSLTDIYINGKSTPYTLEVGGFYPKILPDGSTGEIESFNVYYENGFIRDSGVANLDVSFFEADRVYVSVEIEGISDYKITQFNINQICSMTVGSMLTSDKIAPIVLTKGIYPGSVLKGENVTVYPVVAEDMLDTYTESLVTVTLKKVDGTSKTLLKNADATVSHQVTAEDYGELSISYVVTDGAKQKRQPKYTVKVMNDIPPEITINGELKELYKVGKEITFPQAVAIDDIEGNIEVKYFVVTPAIMPKLLKDGKFTPEYAGVYKFRVYAVDSFGNVSIVDKVFKVVD